MSEGEEQPAGRENPLEQVLGHVRDQLKDLRFGSLLIVVQDGVVLQIERTEKTRFARPGRG
jgi:hypothetical protein